MGHEFQPDLDFSGLGYVLVTGHFDSGLNLAECHGRGWSRASSSRTRPGPITHHSDRADTAFVTASATVAAHSQFDAAAADKWSKATVVREMLDKERELDAVVVAAPDFWHSPHAVACLEADTGDGLTCLFASHLRMEPASW